MPVQGSKREWMNCAALSLLAFLMALNYQVFILHNAFAPAGINGLATMVQYLFHFSVGYMSLLINIPLAVMAFFLVDKRFALKTLLFSLTFSGVLLLLQSGAIDLDRFIYHTEDGKSAILAPVASGTVNGFIYGCAIRLGGSTGGTDFAAAYVHKKIPEYPLIRVIFVLNVFVAALSYFVYDFNIEPVILCVMYCYVTSIISDKINKGGKTALKVEIITRQPEEVTRALIEALHHSVTLIPVTGGYSHQSRSLLVCVINKHQMPRCMEVLGAFPDTFATVSDVTETVGNFKRIRK